MTRIKQLLLLGGLFEIIFTLLALLGNPFLGAINAIAFLIFIVMAIVFLFKEKVAFIHRFAQKHENISAYLYALGWMPYFMIPYTVITSVVIYKASMAINAGIPYVPSNPELLSTYVVWHNLVFFWGLILSLLLATVYVLRNLYLAHQKAPKTKAKRDAKNEPGKQEIQRSIPAKAKRDAKNEPGKLKIAHARPEKAKRDAKNEPGKQEIRRARPTEAKRDAKNEPVKKGKIRQTRSAHAKRDAKNEPGKQEIRRARALKLKK